MFLAKLNIKSKVFPVKLAQNSPYPHEHPSHFETLEEERLDSAILEWNWHIDNQGAVAYSASMDSDSFTLNDISYNPRFWQTTLNGDLFHTNLWID